MATTTIKLQLPLVHLNGSGRTHLVDSNRAAGLAVSKALEALVQAGPNQRDYYPLGHDAWKRAVAEHDARVAHLRRVRDELAAIVEGVFDKDGPTEIEVEVQA